VEGIQNPLEGKQNRLEGYQSPAERNPNPAERNPNLPLFQKIQLFQCFITSLDPQELATPPRPHPEPRRKASRVEG
jgi:hypothetical protein